MYRNLFGILAVFGVAIVLVGLTFSAASEERADYVFNNGSEPKTLDPHKMTGQLEGRIADALFEGLTYNDAKTLRPVPGCAETWETSPDGKRWTFHLRRGLKWSNAEPVTAQDFVWSWVRLQEPETASEYAQLMHMVRHAEAYNTFGGQVKALRGEDGILAGLRALAAAHPDGIPATKWQEFVEAHGVRDNVVRTRDESILSALAKDAGNFTPEESTALVQALDAEAGRRAAALAEAQAHFGKDQGVFATDPSTFVVELNAYTPYFLELTAFYVTFPAHRATVELWPEAWFRPGRIVSNGPFLLERWVVNKKIRMRKNPLYWGAGQVSLETVDALPYDNRLTAFNLYLTGEIDWAPSGYPPDLIDTIKKRADFHSNPGMIVYFYRLNCKRKPFDDPRVRRALGLAFDRRVLVERITKKGETPTTTIVAPGVPDYESPPSRLGFDPVEARRLLAEAGYPDGRGFPAFSIVYNTDDMHKKIADWVADQWKKHLGIEANPRNAEWQSILEDVKRLNYDVERAGWIGDYRDPNTFLDMWVTKNGNNQTGWGDPYYDRLIQVAADPMALADAPPAEVERLFARFKERPRAEERLARLRAASSAQDRLVAAAALRLQIFREAEAILVQDAVPIIPMFFYQVTSLVSPRVEGFHSWVEEDGKRVPNLQDIHPFRDVKIRKPAAAGSGDGR